MSEEIQSQLKTVSDVLKCIPPHWRNADIVIADCIGNLCQINRVSLHKDSTGRRVVMFHEKGLKE